MNGIFSISYDPNESRFREIKITLMPTLVGRGFRKFVRVTIKMCFFRGLSVDMS